MFPVPIIVNDFPQHKSIKAKLLKLLEETECKSLDTLGEQIAKTDWERDVDKSYKEFVLPYIIEAVGPLFYLMNYVSFDKSHVWFQQYETQDFHDWHRHPGTDWGFVYYLELPEDGPPTEFRNPLDPNNTYLPNVKEGQFVLFPAILEHRSNENNSTNRKTVIVTNFITV